MKLFPGLLFKLALLWPLLNLLAPAGAVGPAPTASCVVTAQNRTAPMPADGSYTLSNLPGNGLIPFGSNASAQPFRARVVCDDGTLGETAMLFPEFESAVVYGGDIIWGQTSIKPARLQLNLPASEVKANQRIASSVAGFYENGSTLDLSARATGTGYRSSANGYVGVSAEGVVFGQSLDLIQTVTGTLRAPPQVVITAENDGVVASRVVKLKSDQVISGTVYQADGTTPAAGVKIRVLGSDIETSTDASGKYRLADLPIGSYWVQLLAWQPLSRRFVIGQTALRYGTNDTNLNLTLGGTGNVTVQVLDAAQKPVAGVEVSLADHASTQGALDAIGALAIVPSDANGVARFSGVAAGDVAPWLSADYYAASPANAVLAADGELIFRVTVYGQSNPVSSMSGSVVETQSQLPGAALVVRLSQSGGQGRSWSAVTLANGRFSFEQLPAAQLYRLSLLKNGIVLHERTVYSAQSGQVLNLNLSYDKPARVAGTVRNNDGSSVAPDISVQLSSLVLDTWTFVKEVRTNAQGQYEFAGLPAGSFRLDAVDRNGQVTSGFFDISTPGAEVLRDLTLPADRVVVTRARLDVRDAASNFRIGNASVYVSNSRCATPCLLGVTQEGDAFVTSFLPPGENRFEIRRGLRSAQFAIQVNASTDGQTLSQLVSLPNHASDTLDQLKFVGQRNVLGFTALAGEKVNLAALGAQLGATRAAYTLKVELFDPAKNLLASASGYGFGSDYPSLSRIADVRLESDGTYAVVVTTNSDEPSYLGGYWVDILVDGQARPLQAYEPGGVVQGKVLRADGAPAQNQLLELFGNDPLNLRQQVLTSDAGEYRFDGVPLGDINLKALRDGQLLARLDARLERAGEVKTLDINLKRATSLNVAVEIAPGLELPQQIDVQLNDDLGSRSIGTVYFWGNSRSTVVSAVALGDSFTLSAQHPGQPLRVSQTLAAADGQTLEPVLILRPAALTGRVLFADGRVAAYASLQARRASNGDYLDSTWADENGRYRFVRLPLGEPLIIAAFNPQNQIESSIQLPALTEAEQSAPDITLQATGSISALVKYANGNPLANAQVRISGTLPAGLKLTGAVASKAGVPRGVTSEFALTGSTDSNGSFHIEGVPVGVLLQVQVTNPVLQTSQQQSATLSSAAPDLTLPDFTFPSGTALVINLLDGDGNPNDLVYYPSIGECGGNRLRVDTSAGSNMFYAEGLEPLIGIPLGPVKVYLYDACAGSEPDPERDVPLASGSTVISGDGVFNLEVRVPIISGMVKLSDGRAVRYPNINFMQTLPNGKVKSLYPVNMNELERERGVYNLVGIDIGNFTIDVRDYNRDLSTSVAGQLDAIANLKLDVVLDAPPYDGTLSDVKGVLTQGGAPLADAYVDLVAGGFSTSTSTDANGVFWLQDVPAGSFTLNFYKDGNTLEVSGQSGTAPVVTLDVDWLVPEPLRAGTAAKATPQKAAAQKGVTPKDLPQKSVPQKTVQQKDGSTKVKP